MGTLDRWAARAAEAEAQNLEQRAELASTRRGRDRLQERAAEVRNRVGLDAPTVELPIAEAPGRAARPGGGRRPMPLKQRIQAISAVVVIVAIGWAWLTAGPSEETVANSNPTAGDIKACGDARAALADLATVDTAAEPVEVEASILAIAERFQGATLAADDVFLTAQLRVALGNMRDAAAVPDNAAALAADPAMSLPQVEQACAEVS